MNLCSFNNKKKIIWDLCIVTGAFPAAGQSEPARCQQVTDDVAVHRGLQADVGAQRRPPQSHLCRHWSTGQWTIKGYHCSLFLSLYILTAIFFQVNLHLLACLLKLRLPLLLKHPGEFGVSKSIGCDIFPSVLWHCWLGDRKGIRPVKKTWCWFVGGKDLTGAVHDL